jgi:hypothetical protein
MTRYKVVNARGKLVGHIEEGWAPKAPLHVTQRPTGSRCPHCGQAIQPQIHAADEGPTDEVDWGTWKADTSFEGPCRDTPAGWSR